MDAYDAGRLRVIRPLQNPGVVSASHRISPSASRLHSTGNRYKNGSPARCTIWMCFGFSSPALRASSHTVAITSHCDPRRIALSGAGRLACPASLANQSTRAISTEKSRIHFPGLKGLDKPIVWVFPKLLVCLNCGFTEFAIPETELRVLRDGTDRSAAAS